MSKQLNKRNQGFTIIEVLIVLAIAGVIMLVVFLAVPALQRNSRNTSKRSDVSKALGAAGEYSSTISGGPPVTASLASLRTSANLSSGTTLNVNGGTDLLPATVATVYAPAASEIELVSGVVCNAGASHVTAAAPTAANYQSEVTAGNARSVVAVYSVEAAGNNRTTQCTGS